MIEHYQEILALFVSLSLLGGYGLSFALRRREHHAKLSKLSN